MKARKEIINQVLDLLAYFPGRGRLSLVWLVIFPLAPLLAFTHGYGNLAPLPSGGMPYPVFALHGQYVVWLYFTSLLVMLLRINHSDRSSWTGTTVIIASSVAYGIIISLPALLISITWPACYAGVSFSSALQTLFGIFGVIGGVFLLAAVLGAAAHYAGFFTPLILALANMYFYLVPVGFSIDVVPEHWRSLLAAVPLTPAMIILRNGILNLPSNTLMLYGILAAIHAILGYALAFWILKSISDTRSLPSYS